MYDAEINEWRKLLQKARGIYKKIQKTQDQKEKTLLIEEHKRLLGEARKKYNEIYKQTKENKINKK